MTEIHLPGVAGHDVPALRQRDREQDQEDEVQHVVAARDQRQERQPAEAGQDADRPRALAPGGGHLPKSPRGRTTSTTTKITRPTTSR